MKERLNSLAAKLAVHWKLKLLSLLFSSIILRCSSMDKFLQSSFFAFSSFSAFLFEIMSSLQFSQNFPIP